LRHRLFLQVGDKVYHEHRRAWGIGRVVEVRTSTLEGGPALVRIVFQDGKERTFFNDLGQPSCCFYLGVRFYEER
jgi:hypothetical protein